MILDQIRLVLFEGQNEDNAKNKLKSAGKESAYEDLLSITSEYKKDPAGKNNKHLPKLVDFYLNDNVDIDTLKDYYVRFITNTRLKTKPIDDINSFSDFEQLVDNTQTQENIPSGDISDDSPIYENEDVKIFLGDTKNKCIKYGQDKKFGFCISRTDASNLYHGYRSKGATFYFVYFKNDTAKNGNAPKDLIVIHVYPNGKYMINYASPNHDNNIDKTEIIKQFPTLNDAFEKDILVYRPFSEKEEYVYNNILGKSSITDFKKLDDKLMWIELGKKIRGSEWGNLGPSKEEIIKKYIEVGLYEIPDDVLVDYPKLQKRYEQKMYQTMTMKIENGLAHDLNTIEKNILSNLVKNGKLSDTLIDGIIKSENFFSYFITTISNGKNLPDKILDTIVTNTDYLYDYVRYMIKWGDGLSEIPEKIYNGIKNPKNIIPIMRLFGMEGIEIPYEFIDIIANSIELSSEFVIKSGKDYSHIPKKIINTLLSSENKKSIVYMKMLNDPYLREFPEEILNSMTNVDSEFAYKYIIKKPPTSYKIPAKILIAALKYGQEGRTVATHLVKNSYKYEDDFIQEIQKHPDVALTLANNYIREDIDVPQFIIDTISTSAKHSMMYATTMGYKDIPQEIINGIQKDPDLFEYFKTKVGNNYTIVNESIKYIRYNLNNIFR